MAQVTERTSKLIKKKLKIDSDEEYQNALSKKSIKTFKKLINEIQSGVINVYGRPGSGRTLVAKKVLYYLQKRGFDLNVTMDSKNGFRYISKETALLVLPGTIEISGKDHNHQNVEPYLNYCVKRNGIAIIMSSDPISEKYVQFALETAGEKYDDNDNLVIKTILTISNKHIGYVAVREILDAKIDEKISDLIKNAKDDYMTDEVQRIINNIEKYTQEVLNQFIISEKILFFNKDRLMKRDNDIKATFNIALGGPGSGKTTLSRILLHQLILEHSKKKVHAISHQKELGMLLHRGFSNDEEKIITFMKVDDATYELQDDPAVFSKWIRIRHEKNKKTGGTEEDKSTGIQMGRVITWLNLHEFEGKACPKAFRQKVDNLWIMEIPANMHDRHLVRNFLEQGIYYDFLEYITKKRNAAIKREDIKAMEYWSGWGVVRTKEGIFPFRLNIDDEKYEQRYFDILNVDSTWRETWEEIVDYMIEYFENIGIDKPSTTMINAEINKYEMKQYGRLRPQSEQGVNYRKSVSDNVKAYFEMGSQRQIRDDEDDDKSNLKPKKTERKQFDEYDLQLIDVEIDKAFLEKMIEIIPEMRKAQNIFDGRDGEINDWKRHRSVLYWYLYGSQRDAASVDGVSQTSITKWSKQYKEGGKYNKEYYWGQGYDAEVALEEILEPSWKKGGENKSEPDLYNLEEKKLISLKCISHTSYWDYLDRVGQEELSWVHEKDFDGELWIYILPRQQWRKYKILPKED